MATPTVDVLRKFHPLGALSDDRLQELASFCGVESVAAGQNPLPAQGASGESVYISRGRVRLTYADGSSEDVTADTEAARLPLGSGRAVHGASALEASEVIRVDNDLVDIMVTWNQIEAIGELGAHPRTSAARGSTQAHSGWTQFAGVFSVDALTSGAFGALPPAHIAELLERFEPIDVRRGQVIVREGESGDYYYVVEAGRVRVTRVVGGVEMPLADLKSGDAFGEEALIAEGLRNATATMKTDGRLLRLAKRDFDALLKRPLLSEISYEEALARVAAGGQWLDVRFPSEYQHDRIAQAVNIPLGELRHALDVLDQSVEYIAYCQSGRRSAAAAFLLAQRGYRAAVLAGGLYGARGAA
jgi:rhodanese-related sulfurtransferase